MEKSKEFWENRFIELFNSDNRDKCTPHFDYKTEPKRPIMKAAMGMDIAEVMRTTLRITTFNPNKGTSFLMLELSDALNEEEAIKTAFQELVSMHKGDTYATYTLEWGKFGASKTETSYFSGKNEFDVLTKFYAEKEPNSVIFYSLKVNPIS